MYTILLSSCLSDFHEYLSRLDLALTFSRVRFSRSREDRPHIPFITRDGLGLYRVIGSQYTLRYDGDLAVKQAGGLEDRAIPFCSLLCHVSALRSQIVVQDLVSNISLFSELRHCKVALVLNNTPILHYRRILYHPLRLHVTSQPLTLFTRSRQYPHALLA